MKGVSLLVQDGKIAEIGAKLIAPKGIARDRRQGNARATRDDRFGHGTRLSEISAVRETVDTGEIGEFMPQLRALVAVNPESEHFGVVRVNGITSVMTFPSSGRRWWRRTLRGRRAAIHLRPGGADSHRRLDLGRDGGGPERGHAPDLPEHGRTRRTRRRGAAGQPFRN